MELTFERKLITISCRCLHSSFIHKSFPVSASSVIMIIKLQCFALLSFPIHYPMAIIHDEIMKLLNSFNKSINFDKRRKSIVRKSEKLQNWKVKIVTCHYLELEQKFREKRKVFFCSTFGTLCDSFTFDNFLHYSSTFHLIVKLS